MHLIIVEDHLSVQPKNIYVPQQRVAPGVKSYASATKSKNKKVSIIWDSHLKRINKGQFRKELCKRFSYFKWFSGANTKQINYHIVATLVDETPQTVVIHVGSNDITKMNYRTTRSCATNNWYWVKV